jgi:heat shock protein HtpX
LKQERIERDNLVPLTFIEIEKQKSWRISVFFTLLFLLYFFVILAFVQGFVFLFGLPYLVYGFFWFFHKPLTVLIILLFSILTAGIHFGFSAFGAVNRVMRTLEAAPPDVEDGVHKRLMDIIEEIHIATGNKRRMEAMVIPSLSMNALAVADLRGDAVIAITEGLLSKLSRPQLESVIAHEACHILSGDCLETTVAASLFGIYASAIDKIKGMDEGEGLAFLPAFLVFRLLMGLTTLINMFVSREREYRADAAAVRMTRNPVALAEALSVLSRSWTGTGMISSGIEMLCIVNPKAAELDEDEGWWADLMSTHPPIKKRIEVLLGMAHMRAERFKSRETPVGQSPDRLPDSSNLSVLSGTLVGRIPDKADIGETEYRCPSCGGPLIKKSYERTWVSECASCGGVLVETDKIPRIIARTEADCSERVKSLAKAVMADNRRKMTISRLKGKEARTRPLLHCAKCGNPMLRTFYSLAYLIGIDRCGICGLTWFDSEELTMLQCMIRNKITA